MLKNEVLRPQRVGDIVEGEIVGRGRGALFLDLGPTGTGIIYGKEFYEAKEKLKNLKIGDKIFVKIIDLENEDGYIELSVSGASKEMSFEVLKQKKEKGELILVKILGANKGGLVCEISGIPAFLPVSQLSSAHYPRVAGGEKAKILKELQKFVGQTLEVKILDLDQKNEQIILSEKAKSSDQKRELLKNYKFGDIVEGEIVGLTDFGAFLRFSARQQPEPPAMAGGGDDLEGAHPEPIEGACPEPVEGLIHISELDWKIIESPSEIVKVGDKLQAKIIDISGEKVSLSLKALKKDPWKGIEKKYKKGDVVSGRITKINPFGALVQLTPEIQGLYHVSEFKKDKKIEDVLKIGQEYKFQILLVDEKEHRVSLKLVEKE